MKLSSRKCDVQEKRADMETAKNYLVLIAVRNGAVDDHDRVVARMAEIKAHQRITDGKGKRFALHDMAFVIETTLDEEALTDLVLDTVRRATLHLPPPEVAVFRFDRASWKLRELEQPFNVQHTHLNG